MSRNYSTTPSRNGVQKSAASPILTEKYRRNGKLQSCEPCRKSKLRCDHIVPACGRCVKRGKENQCFYHPNPLTQQRRQTPPTHSIPTPSSASSKASPGAVYQSIEEYNSLDTGTSTSPSAIDTNSDATHTLASNPRSTHEASHAQCQPFHRAASAPPLDYQKGSDVRRNTGFQGPTSHITILSEGLGILEPASDLESMYQQQTIVVTNERVTQGCKVLMFFMNKSMITQFIGRWYEHCEGSDVITIEPVMKEWMQQLWNHHGNVLTNQEPAKIRKLSESVFRNTLTSLEFNGQTTAREWARMSSGPNLRWETLGLIALYVGFCVLETPAEDQLYIDNRVSRECLMGQVKEISERCLAFCRVCEVLDDMFVWLLIAHSVIISVIKGDRSYSTYRATGEAHSAVVAMGLHQGVKANEKVPFFLAEIRKRVVLEAYFQEMGLSTTLGRPPRLSYRYCILEAPYDLTDNQIISTGPELAAALASLDANGYNKLGMIRYPGRMRSHINFSMRREDVIDLALGQYTREEILSRAEEIRAKNERHLASLPLFFQKFYSPAEPLDLRLSPLKLLSIIALRMGPQSNEILLQRLLIRKTGASSEKLIQTARTVFRDILLVTQRFEIATKFQASYTFLLCGHGLRVAAIIATELFKQEMLPQCPENPLLPRSQTIQDLAIFASRLGTVDPKDGSYNLCEQGKRVISKILDRILSPQGARPSGGGDKCNHEVAAQVQQQQQQQQQPLPQTQAAAPFVGQMELDRPMNTIGTSLNGMGGMGMSEYPGYGMMDVGIGVEAPVTLGQDTDFMSWLEGMNWEMTDNWSM